MSKLSSLSLAAALAMGTIFFAQTSAMALPCDQRGSSWSGRVQMGATVWGLNLRRQTCATGSLWNYYMWTAQGARMQGQTNVFKSGWNLTVSPINGGAINCNLSGTWARRDVTNGRPTRGSGTATCPGAPTGVWSAAIR